MTEILSTIEFCSDVWVFGMWFKSRPGWLQCYQLQCYRAGYSATGLVTVFVSLKKTFNHGWYNQKFEQLGKFSSWLFYPSRVVSLTGQPLPRKIDQVSLTKPENPVRMQRLR